MSKSIYIHLKGHDGIIKTLVLLKIIQAIPYRYGYLVGRYNVTRDSLKAYAKVLDGK